MAASSRISEEPQIHRKSLSRNNKTGNEDFIVNNRSVRSHVSNAPKKVPVLYYLSRNGHLDHPHLIDVPLSSPHGLYLRDVMNTFNCHRGKGTANMYSWSFKRSYKNGYVWQDASEEDMIQPSNNHDYVLKGSELVQTLTSQNQSETYLTGSSCTSATAAEPKVVIRRRNQSWSSFDNPHEYLVVKCESSRELAGKFAPDVATQTEDESLQEHVTAEVSMVDIASSPPSNSSSEVMEGVNGDQHGNSGRMKLSQVLMQLFTCGADQSAVRKEMTVCEK